ncbi:MAG TPA: hypothetical protein VEI97_19145, partial [bacterium]|nr:hypothetical protein [bacterium]
MHRHWVAPILIVLPLALAACARADGPAVPPAGPGVAASGPFAQVARDGTTHASLFQATLTVDAAGLRAALAPSPVRTATGNDQLAFLDLGAFFNPNTLKVHAVTFGQGTVDVVLQVAHPFPAPDLTQPASATNRADLGFAGRLVVLAEVPIADRPSHSFFGGQVTADTSLVANPDGYVQPRGLIPTAGFANTFPYVLVVDEDKDNRLGVSNQGIPRGNYLPAVGGWQRLNLGPERNGWTGYGYLHQGQTAEITLRLNREALA